ncbi:enoyl-CoA hydratase-related protein [Streptomyces sp. NPDC048254]|uniref:enoyl-CoA hydratase-related protein n=1 Tax=Streptomyces sp. NPDC048254 TaxID=3365525 RepID=UPI003720C49E
MKLEHLSVEHDGPVAVVTLDKPPVNALDDRTYAELTHVFGTIADDRSTRAVVLAAAGRVFCAGADVRASERRLGAEGISTERPPAQQIDPGLAPRECFRAIRHCPVPVVAAVGGAAIGAGLAMISQCDVIVASTLARFGMTEIKVGVLGGYAHLQRLVGPYKARKMYLTGELVGAEELYRLGSVECVTEPADLLGEARRLAAEFAEKSPIAVRLAKDVILRTEDLPVEQAYPVEQDYTARLSRFEDAKEARRAFLEKRDPVFRWS